MAIVDRGAGTTALVFENDRSRRNDSAIARGLLKFWLDRPWVVFIVGSVVTSGALSFPLLLLTLLPESRRWARRTLSQVSSVSLRIRGGRLAVPNQLRPLPVTDVDEIDPIIKRDGHLFNLELRIITVTDRTYRVYFSGLEEDDLDEVLEFLEVHFGGRVRGSGGF